MFFISIEDFAFIKVNILLNIRRKKETLKKKRSLSQF